MKKIYAILLSALTPFTVWAAFNDVTLTTDTIITASQTLTVSGTSALLESIVVNAGNFVVTLGSGSAITVASADRRDISVSGSGSYTQTFTCGDSSSSLALAYSGAGTVAVTVTPQATACRNATGGSPPGQCSDSIDNDNDGLIDTSDPGCHKDGNAANVISYDYTRNDEKDIPANIIATTTVMVATDTPSQTDLHVQITNLLALIKELQAKIAALRGSAGTEGVRALNLGQFTRGLRKSMTHSEVKRLQIVLNSDLETRIAETGAGSPGNETEYFGALTMQAVQRFQIKYGIVLGPDDPGYGYVGPKTRAKLTEISE